ncbi:ABC transporter permease [Microbacterium trichothecenolyticum]|uniref:ABC transporter permease n=1 Tax=Microbacterium trichothecenolyticum TaxID=69370 RepID=UPI001C6EA363|nr:ABC transporter permease [Microbacterium trichothecenolyticum]MBW9121934.1 ABC transporter permease [Microbacterium trichothecenolyticum]
MLPLILRRVRDLAIVLLLVATAIFFIVRIIPGDPAVAIAGDQATQEQIEALRQSLGLDAPLWQQYLQFLGGLLVGDFGMSTTFGAPALPIILTNLPPTLVLAFTATMLSVILAVLLTVRTTLHPGGPLARVVSRSNAVAVAIPEFWIALILILLFAVQLRLVPVSGYVSPFVDPVAALPFLVLPVAVLMINQVAVFSLNLRESVMGEMLQLYLRTARAKGLRERVVFMRHVLPNAMLPAMTVVGNNLGTLLGGVVVIETIFVIPGLGSLLNQAVGTRDYAIIQGVTIMVALMFVLINFIVDLLYVFVDPKVRIS